MNTILFCVFLLFKSILEKNKINEKIKKIQNRFETLFFEIKNKLQ